MLGEILRKFRKERGITQVELAEKLDVSQATVSYWERTGQIQVDMIPDIASAIGVKLTAIYEELGERQKEEHFWRTLNELKGPDQ